MLCEMARCLGRPIEIHCICLRIPPFWKICGHGFAKLPAQLEQELCPKLPPGLALGASPLNRCE
jgi:hypothetical protein